MDPSTDVCYVGQTKGETALGCRHRKGHSLCGAAGEKIYRVMQELIQV